MRDCPRTAVNLGLSGSALALLVRRLYTPLQASMFHLQKLLEISEGNLATPEGRFATLLVSLLAGMVAASQTSRRSRHTS